MAHKGHAAHKKRSLQTKNDRCKQKKIYFGLAGINRWVKFIENTGLPAI